MPQSKFKIVFNGELMPDAVLEEVKQQLAQLFKCDRTRINSLFGGAPTAVKRDLSEAEADKYLAALQRTGAKAYKEPDQAASLSLLPAEDEPAAERLMMVCPKCGHNQEKALACTACGIVIEKFIARQSTLATSPAPTATTNTAEVRTPYAPPQANVAELLPEFGELKLFGIQGRLGRLRYLAWSLVMLTAVFLAAGIGMLAAYTLGNNSSLLSIVGGIIAVVAFIALMVLSIQLGVRRLHDIGWSGWLLLISMIPAVGSIFSIILLLVPGSKTVNRFGPPPPPNSRAVKILASLGLLTIVLGIVAAIAIPAYQGYLERALSGQAPVAFETAPTLETDTNDYP
jgi:uncharacterized membrane protein YhaH (DUF805 family)